MGNKPVHNWLRVELLRLPKGVRRGKGQVRGGSGQGLLGKVVQMGDNGLAGTSGMGGWLAERYGRIMKVGWKRDWGWGSWGWQEGQGELMEMQIASFNSIARPSFDVGEKKTKEKLFIQTNFHSASHPPFSRHYCPVALLFN